MYNNFGRMYRKNDFSEGCENISQVSNDEQLEVIALFIPRCLEKNIILSSIFENLLTGGGAFFTLCTRDCGLSCFG